jgi:hypothetical protein
MEMLLLEFELATTCWSWPHDWSVYLCILATAIIPSSHDTRTSTTVETESFPNEAVHACTVPKSEHTRTHGTVA